MKKYPIAHLALLLTLLLTSCEQISKNAIFWGETKTYEKFLFVKPKPVKMEKTLVFDFNEEAQKLWNGTVTFDVIDTQTDKKSEDILVYQNGSLCNSNQIVIDQNCAEVPIAIEFKQTASEGTYILKLVECGYNGLDRIEVDLGEGIVVKKIVRINPLLLGLLILLVVIIAALVIWFAILRIMLYPTFKMGLLTLSSSEGYMNIKSLKGARKVILTNKNKSQGNLSKIFTGRVVYDINELWDDFTEIIPRDNKSAYLRPSANTLVMSRRLKQNEEQEIVNNLTNKKATIKIQ